MTAAVFERICFAAVVICVIFVLTFRQDTCAVYAITSLPVPDIIGTNGPRFTTVFDGIVFAFIIE